MIISKELLYRQGNVPFAPSKYKDVVITLLNLLTDVKKANGLLTLDFIPESVKRDRGSLVCTIESSYWNQIKVLYDFISSADFTIRFSTVNDKGLPEFYTLNVDKKDLFNWYYTSEFNDLKRRVPSLAQFKSYSDYVDSTGKAKYFAKYNSWDHKEVFGFLEPTKLSDFIFREYPNFTKKVNSNLAKCNDDHEYRRYTIDNIKINVVNGSSVAPTVLDFPVLYYNPRVEETRLNQYIVDIVAGLDKENSEKLNDVIYQTNKPLTAFVDIETNVGPVEEGDLPWDIFNSIVNSMDNSNNIDDDGFDSVSANILAEKKHTEEPKYGYSDKDDDEISDILNGDKEIFSSPSDPYQPINTISVAVDDKILVLSRRKFLTEEEIRISQMDIDNHFKDIKKYQEKPFKFKFIQFNTEYELIEFFLSTVVRNVSAVTGWNFFGYDWPYIINRYFRVLRYWLGYNYSTRANISRITSPINISQCVQYGLKRLIQLKPYDKITDNDLFEVVNNCLIHNDQFSGYVVKNIKTLSGRALKLYLPNNRIIYDYLEIYGKWDKTIPIKESMTLDWTSQTILNVPKLPHTLGFDEFYAQQFRTYVVYNAIDSILVSLLDKAIKTSDLYFSFCAIMMIEPNYALSSVRPITNVISNFANRSNLVFPIVLRKKQLPNEIEYPGAYVKAPTPGIYTSVIALDYASLYPSTIRSMAISPENLIFQGSRFTPTMEQMKEFIDDPYAAYNEYIECHKIKEKFESEYETSVPVNKQVPRDERVYTVSGAVFKKDKDALMPSVLTHYYNERVKAKKQMKQAAHNVNEVEKALLKRFPDTKYHVEF